MNCAIRSSALFNGLTEADFSELHQPVQQMTLQAGATLYRQNDKGDYLFTVRSGLIKLLQLLPDGSPRIVRLGYSTDVLGLEVLVGERYEHEAVALRDTELCRYPAEAVHHLSRRNPVMHRDLMAKWQKALTEADVWLTQLSTRSAKVRMANLLLRLAGTGTAAIAGSDNGSDCYLFSREDIGSILNMTTETASRLISDFKRLGLITEISHNHFDLDVNALQAVVSE